MCVSSCGEAGQQVTGLPVGAGCTEALLLPLVAAPVSGLSAVSNRDLSQQSSEVKTSVLSSVWSEAPSSIFLFPIMWVKREFGDIAVT